MKKHRLIASATLAVFAIASVAHAATDATETTEPVAAASTAPATKTVASGAEVVRGLQSLTPEQIDKVLAQVDKFDDNTKRQFKDAVLHPSPFTTSLLVAAADRISPESRQQLADAIVKVKGKK